MKMNSFQDFSNYLLKYFKKITAENPMLYDALGSEAVKRIRTRTRLGKGVNEWGGNPEGLAKLAKSTIKGREKMATSSMTEPKKSNLTMTGHMLDSLEYKVKSNGFQLGFSDSFAEDKMKWAEDGSANRPKRKFFRLSSSEINGLQKIAVKFLSQLAKAFRL